MNGISVFAPLCSQRVLCVSFLQKNILPFEKWTFFLSFFQIPIYFSEKKACTKKNLRAGSTFSIVFRKGRFASKRSLRDQGRQPQTWTDGGMDFFLLVFTLKQTKWSASELG
jgi:hypothetical protein